MERISNSLVKQDERNQPSSSLTLSQKRNLRALQTELAAMCLNRGEEMDAIRLVSYSKAIPEGITDADALDFMVTYGKQKRGEFDAKIPALGEFLEMLDLHAKRRRWDSTRAEREESERVRRKELEDTFEREREAGFRAWKAAQAASVAVVAPVSNPKPVLSDSEALERLEPDPKIWGKLEAVVLRAENVAALGKTEAELVKAYEAKRAAVEYVPVGR